MEANEIVAAVRRAIGGGSRELQRAPAMTGLKEDLGELVFDKPLVREFEEHLEHFTGAQHAVALSSGTAALHCALMAAGVRQGDEVLCPSLTFAATANAIVHCGAIPHFIDSNIATLGVHSFKLRQYLGLEGFEQTANGCMNLATRRKVAAIVPVHLLGIPCEIHALRSICDAYGITVIEDAAEALGSRSSDGSHCGMTGRAGILSFNLNKIVTTGGGGAVITDDLELANRVRHLATQAKVNHPFLWQHDEVGWNYRMPPLCAALGISQMQELKQTLKAKAELTERYALAFDDIPPNIAYPGLSIGGNNWLNFVLLDPRIMDQRDDVLRALLAEGFEARALFTPLHKLPHFAHCPRQGNLATADDLFRRCICLPSTVRGEP